MKARSTRKLSSTHIILRGSLFLKIIAYAFCIKNESIVWLAKMQARSTRKQTGETNDGEWIKPRKAETQQLQNNFTYLHILLYYYESERQNNHAVKKNCDTVQRLQWYLPPINPPLADIVKITTLYSFRHCVIKKHHDDHNIYTKISVI